MTKMVAAQRTVFTETVDQTSRRSDQFTSPEDGASFLPCRRESNCPIDLRSQRRRNLGKISSSSGDL